MWHGGCVTGHLADLPAEGTELRMRPPQHRVSPRAVWYWTVRAACGWLLLIGAEVLWMLLARDGQARWHTLALLATLVAAAAHLVVMPRWRFRVHRWEATPHAVYTQAGWFDQQRRIAPISRIQTVDTERGPFEQIFGLSNVTVTTASAAGPLSIVGLDQKTAQRLVADLASAAEQTRGDAT
jgi:membrane protein YdbS with pleckstrin-like domain